MSSGTQAKKASAVHCNGGNAANSKSADANAPSDRVPNVVRVALATMRLAVS